MKKNQGFTLIELMIVIAIIAILMAYAIPAYRDYTVRAKRGECNSATQGLKTAMVEYNYRNLAWPASMGDLNYTSATTGNNVTDISVAQSGTNGDIVCTLGTDAGGGTVTWTGAIDNNTATVLWTCVDSVAAATPNWNVCP